MMITRKYKSKGVTTITVAPILEGNILYFVNIRSISSFHAYLSDVGNPPCHIEKGIWHLNGNSEVILEALFQPESLCHCATLTGWLQVNILALSTNIPWGNAYCWWHDDWLFYILQFALLQKPNVYWDGTLALWSPFNLFKALHQLGPQFELWWCDNCFCCSVHFL